MNPTVVEKTKIAASVRTRTKLLADASGKVPTRLQIIKAGKWNNSIKGDLEITIADLEEMVENFNRGIGLPLSGAEGAAIDYKHEEWSRAAGWIKKLTVENGILYADEIEWTPRAQQEINDGEWKFFSPSFYPACLGSYFDHEDPSIVAKNVLVGGGLTNIPFFKGLTGLKASTSASAGGNDSEIFINDDLKGIPMDLSVIKQKAPADVTAEEKAFLLEHKAELTASEIQGFGLEESQVVENEEVKKTPAEAVVENEEVEAEETTAALALQASVKSGKAVLVEASEYAGLKASVEKLTAAATASEDARIDASIKEHIARGAIKADQTENWKKLIKANADAENLLKALPDNKLFASEIGSSNDGAGTAEAQFDAKVKAAQEEHKMDYATAVGHVAKSDPVLANAREAELKEGK